MFPINVLNSYHIQKSTIKPLEHAQNIWNLKDKMSVDSSIDIFWEDKLLLYCKLLSEFDSNKSRRYILYSSLTFGIVLTLEEILNLSSPSRDIPFLIVKYSPCSSITLEDSSLFLPFKQIGDLCISLCHNSNDMSLHREYFTSSLSFDIQSSYLDDSMLKMWVANKGIQDINVDTTERVSYWIPPWLVTDKPCATLTNTWIQPLYSEISSMSSNLHETELPAITFDLVQFPIVRTNMNSPERTDFLLQVQCPLIGKGPIVGNTDDKKLTVRISKDIPGYDLLYQHIKDYGYKGSKATIRAVLNATTNTLAIHFNNSDSNKERKVD